eukprot:14892-Heterococcus_DN1.PRE.1
MQKHVKAARAEAALQSRLATLTEPTGSGAYSTSSRGSTDAAATAAGGGSSTGNRTAPCSPGEVFMSGFSRAVTERKLLRAACHAAKGLPLLNVSVIEALSSATRLTHAHPVQLKLPVVHGVT